MLAFAIGAGIFFLVWGIVREGGDSAPWIPAGLVFSGFMVISVLGREVVLRRRRDRRVALERTFERQLADVQSLLGEQRPAEKFSLERHDRMISEIRLKSEAAEAFGMIAAAHKEVLELCSAYLAVNEREMPRIAIGSPRLAAFGKGRDFVGRLHRRHMMQWAEIESRGLAARASLKASATEKLELMRLGIAVIDTALADYPSEAPLLESRQVLAETLVSIQVGEYVENAERAVFKGDFVTARSSYRDALFYLGRDGISNPERERAAERIRQAIDRLSIHR